jgi:hypothetical protein
VVVAPPQHASYEYRTTPAASDEHSKPQRRGRTGERRRSTKRALSLPGRTRASLAAPPQALTTDEQRERWIGWPMPNMCLRRRRRRARSRPGRRFRDRPSASPWERRRRPLPSARRRSAHDRVGDRALVRGRQTFVFSGASGSPVPATTPGPVPDRQPAASIMGEFRGAPLRADGQSRPGPGERTLAHPGVASHPLLSRTATRASDRVW